MSEITNPRPPAAASPPSRPTTTLTAVHLEERLIADGYPPAAGPAGCASKHRKIDTKVARKARCSVCDYRGLDLHPFHSTAGSGRTLRTRGNLPQLRSRQRNVGDHSGQPAGDRR